MNRLFYWTCVVFLLSGVHSMAIHGPALTRYDPCGLGVIHFDKVTQIVWRAVVNFELYPHLSAAVIDIQFGRQVEIYGVSCNLLSS